MFHYSFTRVGVTVPVAHDKIESMSTDSDAQSSLDIPNALLVYTRDNGKRQVTYIPPQKNKASEEACVAIEKYVRDARKAKPKPTIVEHGFQLIKHATVLTKKDFYTNPNGIIEKIYYNEVAEAIKHVCPDATEVKSFHHMASNPFNMFSLLS